ncbi:MAG: alcohol dehydrogenase catalytic domain-containing protein [Elusimicrobia bacterium]|nr:alcohol dehydrogenase catalytic domain-containing protein [Elusimicrobiota bacterium]
MKAILARDGAASLAEIPVPSIGDGELLLKVEVCGLCGTDVMKLDSRAPEAVLGHELCGVVAKAGLGAPFSPGERIVVSHHVPCLACHWCRKGQESMCRQFKATNLDPGGFADFARVSALHARHAAFRVPDGLDPLAASQTEPLACVLRNLKRLNVAAGDCVGVVGLGAMGQMTGQMLALTGAAAVGLDLDEARAARFRRWGAAGTDAAAFAAAGRERSEGRGFDAVVFSAGTPALARESLAWLRDGGTLNVFASFHPDPVLPLDWNEVYSRELSVVSSYSPSLADLKEAFDLIASRRFDPLALEPETFPLSAFDEAVRAVKTRRALKSVLVPR